MASNSTIGALRVSLGIDSAQFSTGLKKSTKDLDAFGKATTRSLSLVKNFGAGLVAGIAAGGVAGIVNQIGAIATSIATIGDEAKRAGVSIKAFQELKYVAEQNRLGVDSLVDGIKEMQLRIDEFATTGKGSAAEAFMRLGYTADELKRKLADPSALFTEIIGKLGQLDKAAQIRIADEVFGGTGGEKFVQLIDQGAQGIRNTIKEANRLGIVMDDELIRKAAELDRKFHALTTTVATGLKSAIVEAASALSNFISEFKRLDQGYQDRLNASNAGAMFGGAVRPDGVTRSTATTARPTELDARMAGAVLSELSTADQKLVEALKQRYADASEQAIVPIVPTDPNAGGDPASDSALARQAEVQALRLESLQQALMTEAEFERNAYANRLIELQEFLDTKLITQQEFDELDAAARQQHADKMVDIARDQAERERDVRLYALDAVAGTLSTVSGILEREGGKQLKTSKAFGVASAAISTAVGITKAMELPFPASFAVAAQVAATGVAQIAAINSASRGSAPIREMVGVGNDRQGDGGGGGGASQAVSISLQGDYFSKQSVEELIGQFNAAIADGHRLIIKPT